MARNEAINNGHNINIKFKMSNLFNGVEYVNFSVQHHGALKKQMENRLDLASDAIGDELHSLEGQEEPLMDGVNFTLTY